MPVVDVVNLEGKKVGTVDLADAVFSAKVNPHLLHETVRWYLASQRAGTHKTKGRGEISGAQGCAQDGKEEREKVSHGRHRLSDYSPAHHHGKRSGRERNPAHRGV